MSMRNTQSTWNTALNVQAQSRNRISLFSDLHILRNFHAIEPLALDKKNGCKVVWWRCPEKREPQSVLVLRGAYGSEVQSCIIDKLEMGWASRIEYESMSLLAMINHRQSIISN